MELGLRLGDSTTTPKGSFGFSENLREKSRSASASSHKAHLGFCMSLSITPLSTTDDHQDAPIQLDLLPHTPVLRNSSWSSEGAAGGLDVNRAPAVAAEDGDQDGEGSPNSAASSFQMEFCMFRSPAGSGGNDGVADHPTERACSRGSDEDESGPNTRKKLRLSKQQSAFLEESFKEHNTLNPKQKLALAKQLNLRPRQVEVWFQNRRARTKLKQTEVDCEYLKRCCETLTEENRRLQKELQDLRALKSTNSFYMQLPATTLTMCPSCERVAATTSTSAAASVAATTTTTNITTKASGFSLITRPRPSTPFHNATHQTKPS